MKTLEADWGWWSSTWNPPSDSAYEGQAYFNQRTGEMLWDMRDTDGGADDSQVAEILSWPEGDRVKVPFFLHGEQEAEAWLAAHGFDVQWK